MQTAAALQKREKQKTPESAASVVQKKGVAEPEAHSAKSGVPLFLQRFSAFGQVSKPDPFFLQTSDTNRVCDSHLLIGRGLDLQCKTVTAPSMQVNERKLEHGLSDNEISDYGIAYKTEGVNLRDKPGSRPDSTILVRLPFNTRMYVHSLSDGHYLVGTDDGRFGYVSVSHIKTGLPEPDAKIYHIRPGDTALSISRGHYGGEARWGADHRFFVNGLVHVNQGPGKRGIYKPDPGADWDTTAVQAGYMIWVPSLTFMRTLRGVVGSGSITYGAWEKVKHAAIAVGEFLLGTGAFIVGLLHGALESVWDVLVGLKDLLVLAYDLIKWLIGLISGDSKGIFDSIKDVNWGELVQGWIDNFEAKWKHGSLLKRWHFRGWVIGYVIAEILMLIFSGGVIQGIKWIGKSAKVAKVISQIPKIARIGETAKNSKIGRNFSRALNTSGRTAAVSGARRIQQSAAEIVSSMERHVLVQNQRVANAIRTGNRKFFEDLGMSRRQISVLMNPRSRTFAAQYGNAMERSVSRAFRSDPNLSGMIIDARNIPGRVFPRIPYRRPMGWRRPLKPDFGFSSGPLEGHIVDLTTAGGRATKMAKYHDRVLVLEYVRPVF
jgi:hypothetical protein